jgi:hypothetical protein
MLPRSFVLLALALPLAIPSVRAADAFPAVPPPAAPAVSVVEIAADPELVRDATRLAIQAALTELLTRLPVPSAPVETDARAGSVGRFAILPVPGDAAGDIALQLRTRFVQQGAARGFELYSRDDGEWAALLGEIASGQKFGDAMDASTLQKLGRFRGVDGLLAGRVISTTRDAVTGAVRVRFHLQAFRIETGRILWATEKTGVIIPPKFVSDSLPLFLSVGNQAAWFDVRSGLLVAGIGSGLVAFLLLYRRIKTTVRPR